MDRWVGKVAIVTGASSGIGSAICEKMVLAGIKVIGLARRQERVRQLAEKLAAQKASGTLYALRCDMTVEDDIRSAFKFLQDELGGAPLNILINNAGVARPVTLCDGPYDEWRKVIDTNIMGLCIATSLAVKDMRTHNTAGQIVHINSTLGHTVLPLPLSNVYPATKFAVTALTETLRQELVQLGSRIKVTSLSPGFVDTEIASANGFLDIPQLKALVSSAPALTSENIADGVMYILSTPPGVQVTELTIRPIGEAV